MLEDISPLLKFWSIRLLSQPREWRRFVKDAYFQDQDVAAWLGFDVDTAELREDFVEVTRRLPSKFRRKTDSDEKDAVFLKNLRSNWKKLRRQSIGRRLTISSFPELHRRLRVLGQAYDLTPTEQKIWLISGLRDMDDTFRDVLCLMANASRRQYLINLARMMRLPSQRVISAVGPNSNLFRLDLLRWNSDRNTGAYLNCQTERIRDQFLDPEFSVDKLMRGTLTKAPASTLRLGDFPMLKEDLAIFLPYLKKAVKNGQRGVNILLHGPPGTGKTEMSRLIGQTVNRPTYEVATEDHDVESLNARDRMMALTKSLILMRKRSAIIVFDEAEDLFRGSLFRSSFAQERKGRFNQLLETNPVPVIWISNHISSMDPAFLRRFDFVLEFTPPKRSQRRRILSKVGHQVLDEALIEQLADCPDLTPAVVERACRVASTLPDEGKANPSPQRAVRMMLRNTLKAQDNPAWRRIEKGKHREPTEFRTEYLNTEIDLKSVAESLVHRAEGRLCLFGPPGTGKTSFGHFLSRSLERPLLIKRASDLISPYLGMTERNMAGAFEEARRDEAILLIDEVDSFLRDRRGAFRSWEVTEVNEFLTQMESFEGIFIASTNLVDDLDPAAARRFDFKVRFDYLRPDQAEGLLIEQLKRLGIPPADKKIRGEIRETGMLTPGDFANLSREHRLRPFTSAEAFLDALHREVKLKSEGNARKMGFV